MIEITGENDVIQLSIFDCFQFYTDDEEELLKYALQRGSGTVGGRSRITLIVYKNKLSRDEKIDALKKEYGHGGFTMNRDGFQHFWVEYSPSAFHLRYCKDGQWTEKEYNWSYIFTKIEDLVHRSEYIVGKGTVENGNIEPCPNREQCSTYPVGCCGKSYWCGRHNQIAKT